MKYVMVVGDGMADFPIDALGGKTPLAYLRPEPFARVGGGETGRLLSCPVALPPGSDTAFLTLLGNDTVRCYTGRSPLEAAGMGVSLKAGETAFRMNLAAVEGAGFPEGRMLSHNGGGIDGADALTLVTDLIKDADFSRALADCGMKIYPTDTFRHAAVMPGDARDFVLTPPHDIVGQRTGDHLPGGARGAAIQNLQNCAFRALKDHPVNEKRARAGLLPANAVWFWGAGTACALDNFTEKFGVTGTVISAVPLVKGIARLGGLKAPDYPFATGLLDTDYEGKVNAALEALRAGDDFVLLHVEAPDEMSHDGSLENKLEAIRRIASRCVAPLLDSLGEFGAFRLALLPDHYTLLSTRTHDGTPVPYALYDSERHGAPKPFTERSVAEKEILPDGAALLKKLFA